MNLYIKQHVFTFGDKFSIYDSAGNECYYVEGEIFTFGKKLHLYDASGKKLSYIEQQLFTFLPRYSIERNGCEIAEVVKEFTFFCNKYTINGLGWEVDGDFLDHDYEITHNGSPIATVSKEWFTLGDAYEISIHPGADAVNALSVVLVIDACIEAQRRN
jgi:uncharacterized protein YxjI